MDAETFLDRFITRQGEEWSRIGGYTTSKEMTGAKKILKEGYMDGIEKQVADFRRKIPSSREKKEDYYYETKQLHSKFIDIFHFLGYLNPTVLSSYPDDNKIKSQLASSRVIKLRGLADYSKAISPSDPLEAQEAERVLQIESRARNLYKSMGDIFQEVDLSYLLPSNCNACRLYKALCELDYKPKNSIDFSI